MPRNGGDLKRLPKDPNQPISESAEPVQGGRKMELVEVLDVVPVGETVHFVVWREGQHKVVRCRYEKPSGVKGRIPRLHWNWERVDWEIVCGMCIWWIFMGSRSTTHARKG